MSLYDVSEEFRLVVQSDPFFRAINGVEEIGELEVFQNLNGKPSTLGRRDIQMRTRLPQCCERIGDAGVEDTSVQSVVTVVRSVSRYPLIDPAITVRRQERPHDVLDRRTD